MMILLAGGAACGKSALAEQLVERFGGHRYYIATMQPWGKDGQAKVEKHRAMRAGKGFETIECYGGMDQLKLEHANSVVLLECLTNLTSDELFDEMYAERPADQVFQAVVDGVENVRKQCRNLIIITNDVGSDGLTYDPSTVRYQHILGKVNCVVAQAADVVVDMSCGQPQVIKGSLDEEQEGAA